MKKRIHFLTCPALADAIRSEANTIKISRSKLLERSIRFLLKIHRKGGLHSTNSLFLTRPIKEEKLRAQLKISQSLYEDLKWMARIHDTGIGEMARRGLELYLALRMKTLRDCRHFRLLPKQPLCMLKIEIVNEIKVTRTYRAKTEPDRISA